MLDLHLVPPGDDLDGGGEVAGAAAAGPAYVQYVCFSPQADLIGGLLIGAIGLDTLRNVRRRPDRANHLALAALPLVFAIHQLTETFVWGLQDIVPADVGRAVTWIYLLVAFVVLPVYYHSRSAP